MYQDDFKREMFDSFRSSLVYNLTLLDPAISELIVPVIDCTLAPLVVDDVSAPRYFFLVRKVANPDEVYLFSVMMSVQFEDVKCVKYYGSGLSSDYFWVLKSVLENPNTGASKILFTSCPSGYFIGSTNE